MKTITRHLLISLAAFSIVLLSGCQAAATPPPLADTPTDTPTRTITPTLTDTPTIALTNTETFTATPTLTNTPPYNMPGVYKFNKCVTYQPAGVPAGILVIFCVQSVKVYDNLNMQFNVTWRTNVELGSRLTKRSDVNNNNMFIADDLGNAYYAIDWGGSAAEKASVSKSPIGGWFLFPPAKAGATSFIFNDADNIVFIDGIILLPNTGTNTPTFTSTPPTGTPYNVPGTYYIYRCLSYQLGSVNPVQICLNTVVVNSDRTMKFNLSWKPLNSVPARKSSVADNKNIILVDNLKNEYQFINTGGCAAEARTFRTADETCGGWFLFPAAQTGATSFRYVDLGNLISFDDIVLLPK
jgi:hypothetical protein